VTSQAATHCTCTYEQHCHCCRGTVRLQNVTVNSPDLETVRCPTTNTTLRIGRNLTCTGTYTIKDWDLQRPALYFNVQGGSPTLPPDRQARIGPTAVLYMLRTPQLFLDVGAGSCRRATLAASECL
jgi:hypothetical protein